MQKDGKIKKGAAVTLRLAVIVGHLYARRAWIPLTENVAYKHLVGKDECGRAFVAGTYTLLSDSTCKFLVFDFDDHDGSRMIWKDEAKLLRDICKRYGIDTALERSRSGNGAHIWIFFEEPIPAKLEIPYL